MNRDTIATVYEMSVPGRHGINLPDSDVPFTPLPTEDVRADCDLPEVTQLDVVRHYVALEGRREGWLDYESLVAETAPTFTPAPVVVYE